MQLNQIGEFGLIQKIRDKFISRNRKVIVGIGDDAAAVKTSDKFLSLLTTDILIERIHFQLNFTSPFQLGQKALAVNISDIAAMGGIPKYLLISLGVPEHISVEFLDELFQGLKKMAEKFNVNLIGGDTCASKKDLIINISLFGEIEKDFLITRDGANVGDKIFVTGNLGGASSGLDLLKSGKARGKTTKKKKSDSLSKDMNWVIKKHLLPTPRLKEARILAQNGLANSMIDISDGLVLDLNHICQESGVGAMIRKNELPISNSTKKTAIFLKKDWLNYALYGGEDYELLFTVVPDNLCHLQEVTKKYNLNLTLIGEIISKESGIKMIDEKNFSHPLIIKGYEHFKTEDI